MNWQYRTEAKHTIAEYLISMLNKSFRETNDILEDLFGNGLSNTILQQFYHNKPDFTPKFSQYQNILENEIHFVEHKIKKTENILTDLKGKLKKLTKFQETITISSYHNE